MESNFQPLLLLFLFPFLFSTQVLFAQDTTDVVRLRELSYMKIEYIERVNCDSMPGDNLSHRICLNLAFQEADKKMNLAFAQLLETIERDSVKQEIIAYQASWVEHRRRHSYLAADGSRGHLLGIIYLSTMVYITERRLEELRFLSE